MECPLAETPTELLLKIFPYLSPRQLNNLRASNRRLNSVILPEMKCLYRRNTVFELKFSLESKLSAYAQVRRDVGRHFTKLTEEQCKDLDQLMCYISHLAQTSTKFVLILRGKIVRKNLDFVDFAIDQATDLKLYCNTSQLSKDEIFDHFLTTGHELIFRNSTESLTRESSKNLMVDIAMTSYQEEFFRRAGKGRLLIENCHYLSDKNLNILLDREDLVEVFLKGKSDDADKCNLRFGIQKFLTQTSNREIELQLKIDVNDDTEKQLLTQIGDENVKIVEMRTIPYYFREPRATISKIHYTLGNRRARLSIMYTCTICFEIMSEDQMRLEETVADVRTTS